MRKPISSLFLVGTIILLGLGIESIFAEEPLRIIAFGAHPDDCELKAGASAMLWGAKGYKVKFVSTTNGDIGHWQTAGGPLARRRVAEVKAAADILGIEIEVLDIHDGEILPTLENRRTITRLIREWNADIVITHRTNDYHPDHRYTGVLVQDAAFMVTVPFFCPTIPALKKNPVFMYYSDRFEKPNPFEADVVVAIDDVIEKKCRAVSILDSQFVEGGVHGNPSRIPKDEAALEKARQRVADGFRRRFKATADKYRDKLIERYGEEKGRRVKYAEAFEITEYGGQPSPAQLKRMFPF